MSRRVGLGAAVIVLVGLSACDPYDRYCSRIEQCADDEEEGYEVVGYGSDFHAVCVQEMKGVERVLRANDEPECDVAADAYRAMIWCMGGVEDCQDLRDADLGDQCEAELEAYQEAQEDGEECQSGVVPGCGAGGVPALAALMVLLRRRHRRRNRDAQPVAYSAPVSL